MNFDSKRQARESANALFDAAGPSSLGNLPRGKVVPRYDSVIIAPGHEQPASQFRIGAEPNTPVIPDAFLRRGNLKFRAQQGEAGKRATSIAESGLTDEAIRAVSAVRHIKVSSVE